MKLQIASRLAIVAMLELAARPDQQISVAEISAKYRVSSFHLAKVMHVLGRAGLARSIRGARGGYQFSGNRRRTTLLDVIQLFEQLGAGAQAETDTATDEEHALGQVLDEIDSIAQATLGAITLATMLKMIEHHRSAVR
jgi:Rrf2 family protein